MNQISNARIAVAHRVLTACCCGLLLVLCLVGARDTSAQGTIEDEVIAVIDAFHGALAAGDSLAALGHLSGDVAILESGGVENREHYRSGHLASDMRFAQAVARDRGDLTITVQGDLAWVYSTSVTQGRMGEREINSQGAELMVLSREDERWLIRAIHWSSRQRR